MTKPAASTKPPRRRQKDRTRETRKKLLAATRLCVARDGYANATISAIVAEAGLTRGAHLHHFSTKEQLIGAATEDAGRQIYRRLGMAVLNLEREEDRVRYLIETIWRQVMLTAEGRLMLELLNASHSDPAVAQKFGESWDRVQILFSAAADHYFVPKPGSSIAPEDLFELTTIQLQGMLLNVPIVGEEGRLNRMLGHFAALVSMAITPRPGVVGPPPRQPDWTEDEGWE